MSTEIKNGGNITIEGSLMFDTIYATTLDNIDQNDHDYSAKTNADYNRQKDIDKIYSNLDSINWQNESNYHNTYYINGKYNLGRTIKAKSNG